LNSQINKEIIHIHNRPLSSFLHFPENFDNQLAAFSYKLD